VEGIGLLIGGFHNLCSSTNIIEAIKSRKIEWMERALEKRNEYKILVGNTRGKGTLVINRYK
jgi:hypothetical protein